MSSPDRGAAVDLTSLEIIRRYSLAVRQDTAARGDVIAALRADLQWLEGSVRTSATRTAASSTAPKSEVTTEARADAAPEPARKVPAKRVAKAAAAKAPAKKTTARTR